MLKLGRNSHLVGMGSDYREDARFQMKIISWNVRGPGEVMHRMIIKDMVRKNKVQIAMLQETKIRSMSNKTIESGVADL